jgi:hypothetical protein
MRTSIRRPVVPLVGILTSACLVLAVSLEPGFISTGDTAVQEDTKVERACLAREDLEVGRELLPLSAAGFVRPGERGEPLRDRVRPTLPYYSDTEHFRIWYDTSGIDSIYGWPDTTYLHVCKMSAERSWRTLVDTFGFRPPPPDGAGGNDLYDIYIQDENLGQTLHGWPVEGYPPNDYTSYILIHNDWEWFPWRTPLEMGRLIVAHEFGHAVQLAHQATSEGWWNEGSALWGSELMNGDLDDYMLPRWGSGYEDIPPITYTLGRPYEQLDLQEYPYWYSRVLWSFYLSEAFGDSIIPELWHYMEENPLSANEIPSMTVVLASHGVDFEDAFEEYCIWNWFTGDRDDGNHYEEGGNPGWPEATPQAVYSTFPVVDGSPPDTCRPDHLACNYMHFERGSAADEMLRITYDGPSLASVPNAAHVTYLDDSLNSFYYGEIPLSPWGNGEIDVEGFDGMNLVCLVVVNVSQATDNMNYTVDAELIPTGVPDAEVFCLSDAVPNPFTTGTEIAYTIPVCSARVELSIYDVAGRLVTTLVDGEVDVGTSVVAWDGTDADGERAASGIYFARLRAGNQTDAQKVVLVR